MREDEKDCIALEVKVRVRVRVRVRSLAMARGLSRKGKRILELKPCQK